MSSPSKKNTFLDNKDKVYLTDIKSFRTALVRLKSGLEEMGEEFPYTIPPKNGAANRSEERSLSPLDWSQE